jgi:hypothetical protein
VYGNGGGGDDWVGRPDTAGIFAMNGARIENCTIVNNYRTVGGTRPTAGGLFVTNAVVVNCIIYSNAVSASGAKYFSDIAFTGDQAVVMFSCSSNLTEGVNGNITSNPSFVQWPAVVGLGADRGNLDLQGGSRCVNNGTNLDWMATNTDFRGSVRLDNLTKLPDMGAYEHVPAITLFRFK